MPDNFDIDVRFQKGKAHLTQAFLNIFFSQLRLAAEFPQHRS